MARTKYNSFGWDRARARAKKKAAQEQEKIDKLSEAKKPKKPAKPPVVEYNPLSDEKLLAKLKKKFGDQLLMDIDWSDVSTNTHSTNLISAFDKELVRLLDMPTGTGKTAVAVMSLAKLQEQAGHKIKFVVTAPTNVMGGFGWHRTILSYNAAHPDNTLEPLILTTVDKFANMLRDRKTYLEIVKQLGPDGVLVLDEAHKYKSPTTKRSKSLQKMAAFKKIAVTATPLTNDVIMDSASYLIMGGYYDNKTDFMRKSDLERHVGQFGEFNIFDKSGHVNRLIWPYYDVLLDQWSKILYRPNVDLKDLDMPNSNTKMIRLPHSEELSADLRSLAYAYRSRLFDSYIDMFMEYVERVHSDEARLAELHKILDDPKTRQPLIFYKNTVVKDLLIKVMEERGQEYQVISGGSSFDDVDLTKDCPLIVQYQSGAEGIEMKNSNTTIYYQNQSSYMTLTQARGRNVRRGMTDEICHYHIIADDPIDAEIFQLAFTREDVSESMLQEIVEKILNGLLTFN